MYDVAIIGCGVIGAATAYALSRYENKVVILEAENDVADCTTKANSAILHAGYDPAPGTKMARLNVRGVELAKEICAKLDVPYKQCGSLVLALSESELPHLQHLYENGTANGVPDMKILTKEETLAMEPNLSENVCGALWAPSAAIVSPWEYALAMTEVAVRNGVELRRTLTGFKFIGEQIGKLEKQGRADSYVFGFEESYGYLTGSYVRDKDGVDGAYMICEMFSYYATKGISLLDKLEELYKTYGYCLNTLHSYEFDGSAGFAKMQSIMQAFRGNIKAFGGKKVVKLLDYAYGLDGLPKSEVLKFLLEDNCSIVVRPSGTEPKLKIYISVSAENREAAEKVECEIVKDAENWFA